MCKCATPQKRIGIIDFYHEPCSSTQQPFLRRNTACFGSQYGTFHHPKQPILQPAAHQGVIKGRRFGPTDLASLMQRT